MADELETTELPDGSASSYTPPAHRLEKVGDAWRTVVERTTDGGPGPDGQDETVNEQPEAAPEPADEPADDQSESA